MSRRRLEEIVAYPNSPYDDHVDALTNFLSQAADFTADSFGRVSSARAPAVGLALGSLPPALTVGVGMSRTPRVSDFSNRTGEPSNSGTRRSAMADRGPVFSFDGTKIVRLR